MESISQTKSIEELQEEVNSFDTIIVADEQLRYALHGRVYSLDDWMRRCAVTITEKEIMNHQDIILRLHRQSSLDMQTLHHHLENIYRIWEVVGSLNEAQRFFTKEELSIAQHLSDYLGPHMLKQLINEHIRIGGLRSKNVAVIGYDFLSELEKRTIPPDAEKIDPFTEKDTALPKVCICQSDESIVQHVLSMIHVQNQHQIAIVADPDDPKTFLIRERLQSKGISVQWKRKVIEHLQVRQFMELIRTYPRIEQARASDISIIRAPPGKIAYKISALPELLEAYSAIKDAKTFDDLLKLLPETPKRLAEIIERLPTNKLTYKNIETLAYILENIALEETQGNTGVLMLDPKSALWTQRHCVIMLDLDNSWLRTIPKAPYIDGLTEEVIDAERFQILLQQGKQRYLLVKESHRGNTTVPCFMFSVVLNRPLQSFRELEHEDLPSSGVTQTRDGKTYKKGIGFLAPLSQSSLNNLLFCPRRWMLERLAPSVDQEFFLRGNLIHQFAACYFHHPQQVITFGIERIISYMAETSAGITDEEPDWTKTQYTVALFSIMRFIDKIRSLQKRLPHQNEEKNLIAEFIGLHIPLENTEHGFNDERMKGVFDLIVNNSLIVDYKTSRKKTASEIYRQATGNASIIDMQPLLYLAYLSKFEPGQITFTYVYALEDIKGALCEDIDLNTISRTVIYEPRKYEDYITDQKVLNDIDGTRSELIQLIGIANLISFLKEHPPSPNNLERFDDYLKTFQEWSAQVVKKDTSSVLKYIRDRRTSTRMETTMFFKDDKDQLDKSIDMLMQHTTHDFPCAPRQRKDCDACPQAASCTRDYGTKH